MLPRRIGRSLSICAGFCCAACLYVAAQPAALAGFMDRYIDQEDLVAQVAYCTGALATDSAASTTGTRVPMPTRRWLQ